MTRKPRTRQRFPLLTVRAFVGDPEGRILLLRRANTGYAPGRWVLPGGKARLMQSPRQGAVAEVREETGLTLESPRFLFYHDSPPHADSPLHCVILYFYGETAGNVRINDESSDFVWVSPQEALEYHPAFHGEKAVRQLLSENSIAHSSLLDTVIAAERALNRNQPYAAVAALTPFTTSKILRTAGRQHRHRALKSLCRAYLDADDVASARRLLARLRKAGTHADAQMLYLEGRVLVQTGKLGEAMQKLGKARSVLEGAPRSICTKDKSLLAAIHDSLGAAYMRDCSLGNAIVWFERALALRRNTRDRFGEATSYGYLRKLHQAASRYEHAIHYCKNQLNVYKQLHDTYGEAVARNTLADLYITTGRLGLAANHLHHSASLSALPHMSDNRPYVALGNAALLLARGDYREAREQAWAAWNRFKKNGDYDRQGRALLLLARAEIRSGDPRHARTSLSKARDIFNRRNLHIRKPAAALVESEIETLGGSKERAISALCGAIRLSYEFSGGVRGEVFFRDIVRTFLNTVCSIVDVPWAALGVQTASFWKYYHCRRSRFALEKGRVADAGAPNATTEVVATSPARRDLPWRRKTTHIALASRGRRWGTLVVPYRKGTSTAQLELLAHAGPSLGAILEKKYARRDALTGLANRRMFNAQYDEECRRCGLLELPLAAIMLDIDNFKKFNDTYGHDIGDRVLSEVAAVFRRDARVSPDRDSSSTLLEDFAARYGGEELVVLAPGCTKKQALAAARRMRRDVAGIRILHEGKSLKVTASLGVGYAAPGRRQSEVVKHADEALYEAKRNGKNRVAIRTDG